MQYRLLTPELLDQIGQQDRAAQSEWLFLEQSEEFRGCWQVSALWPEYFIEFEPLIGAFCLVTPLGLENFLAQAAELNYQVVFVEDPRDIIYEYERLQQAPGISLHSTLDGTLRGFLPWQVVGYNKLIDSDVPAGYFVWTTGAGKTAMIAAAIEYHRFDFDLAMVVVKSHNKVDTQRKLTALGDIDSVIIDGTQKKRREIYEDMEIRLPLGDRIVAITNYEKFREDTEVLKALFKGRRMLFFWDEIAAKLSNPDTQLYRRVKATLTYPTWMRHWALSATPIENHPGDVWAAFNVMWPGLLGTQRQFEETHVSVRNFMSGKPQVWKNLDHLEAKIAFATHRVSKEDPEVASMFPDVIAMPTIVDWDARHRKVYDKLTGKAADLLAECEDANVLEMILVLQMICDAPSMVTHSARNRDAFTALLRAWMEEGEGRPPSGVRRGSELARTLLSAIDVEALSDDGHTKLEMWHEIIDKHPKDKIVTHSTWSSYIMPVWEHWLQKWGVSYVTYTGTGKQKQAALDRFRSDPDIRLFLSGDAGADSIDIVEARVGINYNVPWKWTTLQQRQGRRDRVNSTFDTLFTYDLIMPDSVDERKLVICERKRHYHEVLFDGRTMEEAMSATLTRAELEYLLTGD